MLYQTHIVLNMSAPISKDFLNRDFGTLYPPIKSLLDQSILEQALPADRHRLDELWANQGLVNIKLTWYSSEKATEFLKLWQSFNTFALVSTELITLEQGQE